MKLFGRSARLSRSRVPARQTSNELLPNQLERLESRMMLAGDVTFSVSGNNLTVKGSAANDCVEIDTQEGIITVNGESTGISANSLNNVKIKTLDGNDEVIIGGSSFGPVEIGGNLKIITKGGEDYVEIYDTEVSGKTVIKTGTGNDIVNTYDAVYGGTTKVVTGSGNDRVCVALNPSMDDIHAESDVAPKAYGYIDNLNVEFDSAVKVKLGADNDELNLGIVSMGEEAPLKLVYGSGFVSFGSSASANGGSGQDFLRIGGSFVDPNTLPSDAAVQVKNFEAPVPV